MIKIDGTISVGGAEDAYDSVEENQDLHGSNCRKVFPQRPVRGCNCNRCRLAPGRQLMQSIPSLDPNRSDASDRYRGGRGCSLRNSPLELANPVSVSDRILAIYVISTELPQRSGERVG